MISSRQQLSRATMLARLLFAVLLASLMSGCAWLTTKSEAQPKVRQEQDKASSSQEVEKRPHESIESLLNARTAGVIVTVNADRSLTVRIRGTTSIYGSNEPLYVIDGVPVRVGPGGTIAGVNPYEIASIRVLKGPPETTIYGVRGANGVILIKTKQLN
jgi:TonB-dependent SusC/RagA subfamily outer membrane receptor